MPLSVAPAETIPLLDRYEDVAAFAERARAGGIMALDTEFVSERTYQPQLALLQVATPDEIVLIDPLSDAVQKAADQPIWDAMADPSVRTVVHAHDQEAQFCMQRTGRAPGDLFDVQLAAAFSGHRFPIAYDKLVGRELRLGVGPSQSRTNWLQRPLTAAQRRYAADDVRWLLQLHDRFVDRFGGDARHVIGWLREETDARLERLGRRDEDRWQRIAGASKLRPRSQVVLSALSDWRERVAQERNKPIKWVVPDQLLTAIASSLPATRSELESVRGIKQLNGRLHGDVLRIVAEAKDLPRDGLPERERTAHGAKPSRMVVLFLQSVLAAACAEQEIAADLVGGGSQLRQLIAWDRDGRTAGGEPAIMQGWRREVVGEPLLAALDGRVSLRISNPLAEHPLTVSGLNGSGR